MLGRLKYFIIQIEELVSLSLRFLATLVQFTELHVVWSVSNCREYNVSETEGDFNFEFNKTLSTLGYV